MKKILMKILSIGKNLLKNIDFEKFVSNIVEKKERKITFSNYSIVYWFYFIAM